MKNFIFIPSAMPDFQKRIDERIFKEIAHTSLISSMIYLCLYLAIGLFSPLFLYYIRESIVFGVLLGGLGIIRCVLAYRLSLNTDSVTRIFRESFFCAVLCTSATWGLLCAFLIYKYKMSPTAMIVLLPTAGIAGGSIISLGPFFRVISTHLCLLLLPTVYVLMCGPQHNYETRSYAILILIFLGYLLIQSKVGSAALLAKARKAVIIEDQNQMLANIRSRDANNPLNPTA